MRAFGRRGRDAGERRLVLQQHKLPSRPNSRSCDKDARRRRHALCMRFSTSRGDVRIQVLVATLDDAEAPVAATWRAVGEAAEELGLTRPSYYLVRTLARAERLRRR